MREPLTCEINGKPATIPQLDAATAFDVGCIVAEWYGRMLAASGDDGIADQGLGAVAATGRILASTAKKARDPEYRSQVWARVLHGCTLAGLPVFAADGKTLRPEHEVADLWALHERAIEHSCGPFLAALGAGVRASP